MITDAQLEEFRLQLDKVNREYYERQMTIPNYFGGIEMKKGSKNAKYLITTGGSRAVLLFVDLKTGDILKQRLLTHRQRVRGATLLLLRQKRAQRGCIVKPYRLLHFNTCTSLILVYN